jgi:4'-phosphopantetheinyl transferase
MDTSDVAYSGLFSIPTMLPVDMADDEVHIWRAGLGLPPACLQCMEQTLSPGERARAEELLSRRHRSRVIASHGILRAILGAYLTAQPADLRFRAGPNGKPAVVGKLGWPALQFSMSHSHFLGLYAVARDRRVGVDVERVRKGKAYSRLADRYFGAAEIGQLDATPAHLREPFFLRLWTRKEAYVKAIGDGLPSLPDSPDLTALSPEDKAGWHIFSIEVGADYAAAAAVEGAGCKMRLLQWSRLDSSSATGGLA